MFLIRNHLHIIIRILLLVSLLSSLAACTSPVKFNSDLSDIPSGKATVFFYYKSKGDEINLDFPMPVIANGVEIGKVEYGRYIKRHMEPGTYKIHSRTLDIDRQYDMTFRANQIYYVKIWKFYVRWGFTINFI